jgi:hypothetical protein
MTTSVLKLCIFTILKGCCEVALKSEVDTNETVRMYFELQGMIQTKVPFHHLL